MGESPSPNSVDIHEEGELSNDGELPDNEDLRDLFVVDSTPGDTINYLDTPVYEQKFKEVLQVKPIESVDTKPKGSKPAQSTCWNCGGEHSLRECEEPRNHDAITRNRMKFMANRTTSKASRYHLDVEFKYPHLEPGKISKKLRRALGLASNQLPRHIYRMRTLGYPPGWVEEAKVSHSGLFLFDSEGQEIADPGFEAGEIPAVGAKDKYDIKRIIEYPGFNCPCNPDIIDEWERLNSRPMAEKDSIDFMKTMWQPKAVKAYKRRKMNSSDTSGTPSSLAKLIPIVPSDYMELDSEDAASSDEEGAISDQQGENPEAPASQSTPIQAQKRKGPDSPKSTDSKRLKLETDPETAVDSDNDEKQSATTDNSTCANSPAVEITPNIGSVTSVTLGTPVIVTSPYLSLPSSDKFAKNICDVLNFENLPDATGKYEKMSGLIKKVRTFVSRLQSEEEED